MAAKGEPGLQRGLLSTTVAALLFVSACGQSGGSNNGTQQGNVSAANNVAANVSTNVTTTNSSTSSKPATEPTQNTVATANSTQSLSPSVKAPITAASPSNQTAPAPNPPGQAGAVEIVQLSNATQSWWYTPNTSHTTPAIPAGAKSLLVNYSGYYVGSPHGSTKSLYLTFDEGYENGYTSKILDVLKSQHVKAAFFVTASYIRRNPDLIRQMVAEGHLVGNHSSRHLSMPSLANNLLEFNREFTDTETAYKGVTGREMPRFFRPPMGEYSEKTLYLTQQLGYKSVFWSFAHRDWETNQQPAVSVTHDRVVNGTHPGAIILLHAVSQSDTDALSSIITDLQARGYTWQTLWNL